jgi:hypothetical protein
MDDTNVAVDKLQRIQQLWVELGRTKLLCDLKTAVRCKVTKPAHAALNGQ